MRWLWNLIKWAAFAIIVLPVADKHLLGQGKLPPIVVPQGWAVWDATQPPMREYAQPFFYAGWWDEIGACEHVIVPKELTQAVHFVFVNTKYMVVDEDPFILGFADAPHFTIYVVLPLIYNKAVIEHEMLHVLDYWNGIDEGITYHPRSRFEVCNLHTYYDYPKGS